MFVVRGRWANSREPHHPSAPGVLVASCLDGGPRMRDRVGGDNTNRTRDSHGEYPCTFC